MRHVLLDLFRFVRPLLAGWLVAHSLGAWALSGADVAYLVNQRYRNTPAKCFVNSPAQECSGVLMRVPPTAGGDLFALSAAETAAGTARFDYVRSDIETTRLANSVGFILADRPTAAGAGQAYDLRCGCPPPGASGGPPCVECPGQPNSAGVSLWNPATPDRLAVQAIFYDVGNGGQLATALEYQRQFYNKTRQWLPILQVLFRPNGGTSFGYDDQDQLDIGYATLASLNARYADTRRVCADGRSAYYCNGVLVRVTGWGAGFKSWNPSPGSVSAQGVSFSFLRADAGVNTLYWKGNDAGIVMRELAAPARYPLRMRCIYAQDAGTSTPDRCHKTYPVLCNAMNITTPAAFRAHYRAYSMCAFDVDPVSFQLSIDSRPGLPMNLGHMWNEAIIAIWPQNVPLGIGIEAFFFMANDASGGQFVQRDYMATTGRFMPLIKIDFNAASGRIFSYDPALQSFALSGPRTLPPVPMDPADIPE
ncbi:hypothetical protein [Pandoraea anhela]|uniref:Uncharacterized protein n=1 Tax=Pandoraea anhela TaxID=2508295 RepID=A0A5E4STV3_9BURK|nr:hypothetical protein [Pandoraea anhela]VVD78521.1 hypothetical protein PAN31108_00986 [Pandoraea anhela]